MGESDGYEHEVDFEARQRGGFSDEQVTVEDTGYDIIGNIGDIEVHFEGGGGV